MIHFMILRARRRMRKCRQQQQQQKQLQQQQQQLNLSLCLRSSLSLSAINRNSTTRIVTLYSPVWSLIPPAFLAPIVSLFCLPAC